jgi:uncharacterized protein
LINSLSIRSILASMLLKEKISQDLKQAMKSGDALKRDTLRMLESMIHNAEIEKKKKEEGLTDAEVIEILSRAVKQRRDSVEQYEKGGRSDLAEKEKKEIEIISAYLPEQLGEDKIREIVKEVITQTGASSKADIGRVMGQVMGRLKGQAGGNTVKKIVEEELK